METERREWKGAMEMERREWKGVSGDGEERMEGGQWRWRGENGKGAVESEAGDKCVTHSAIPIAGGSGLRARQENENRANDPIMRGA